MEPSGLYGGDLILFMRQDFPQGFGKDVCISLIYSRVSYKGINDATTGECRTFLRVVKDNVPETIKKATHCVALSVCTP